MARVAIVRGTDPYETTLAALNLIATDIPAPQSLVLLKPNLLMTKKFPIAVTDPNVCAAVADFLMDQKDARNIFVGEGTTGGSPPDTFQSMENNGYNHFQDRWSALDFTKEPPDRWFPIYNPGDSRQLALGLAKSFTDCKYVVSIPKFKTHDVLGLTLSLKNFMGTLCAARDDVTHEIIARGTTNVCGFMHGFGDKKPDRLSEAQNIGPSKVALAINLIRLGSLVHPQLAIIDGIQAMEGNGPASRGTLKNLGLIIAGTDFIAVDTVATFIAGMNPFHFQYINQAGLLGLGESQIDKITIVGEALEDVISPFRPHRLYTRAKFSHAEINLLQQHINEL
ncbi:MAG: DUF362 domain-containing protein [Candidatus Helarchaeota archaeon]